MDSASTAISVPGKTKKRAFSEASSVDLDVVEISPPPVNRSAKSKDLKMKGVQNQEIIDVDMDENYGNIYPEGKTGNKYKGKRAARINTVGAHSTSNSGSVYGDLYSVKSSAPGSQNIVNLDDFESDLSYLDDNHPGVEAPVSWFPGPTQHRSTLAFAENSNESMLRIKPSDKEFLPILESSHSLWSVDPQRRKSTTSSSFMETLVHGVSQPHKKGPSSLWSAAENGQTNGWPFHNEAIFGDASIQGPHNPPDFTGQYYTATYGGTYFHSNTNKTVGDEGFASGPHMHTSNEAYSINANGFNLNSSVFPENSLKAGYEPYVQSFTIQNSTSALESPFGSSFRSHKIAADLGTRSGSSSKRKESATPKQVDEDNILKKFREFKKFDIVEDPSDNHYVNKKTPVKQPSSWSKKIQQEWKILEKDLPDTIFVRAYESRMDLLRAVIVGAEGTPYHDGLFFFDVFFPHNYPNVPPHVYYNSRGLRLNPNLYANGKVCLSLLNTWRGGQKERWIPKSSTMLQVLVSIQGLILNAKPYFNEPGWEHQSGTPGGEVKSQHYNETTFILSLKTMVFTLRKQPKVLLIYKYFCASFEYVVLWLANVSYCLLL
nr:PREDICTED: uncharacterized protein LOC108227122 isoform X3 [Daucus carota subsp. sativus]